MDPEARGWMLAAAFDALGVLFVWAGVSKVLRLHEFHSSLLEYGAIRALRGTPPAALVPGAELLIGVSCFVPQLTRGAAAAAAIFLFAAAVVVGASLRMHAVPGRCGCFGTDEPPTAGTVGRALALAALSAGLALQPGSEISSSSAALLTGGVALASCAGLACRSVVSVITKST